MIRDLSSVYRENGVFCSSDLNIDNLAKIFDIHVVYYPVESSSIMKIPVCEGVIWNIATIDSKLPKKFQYEVFCHELAHFLLGHSSGDIYSYVKKLKDESQADKLSLYIAIPTSMLLDIDITSKDAVDDIASTFRVSKKFAYERLQLLVEDMSNRRFYISKASQKRYTQWLHENILCS